jgi:hypothetical protein
MLLLPVLSVKQQALKQTQTPAPGLPPLNHQRAQLLHLSNLEVRPRLPVPTQSELPSHLAIMVSHQVTTRACITPPELLGTTFQVSLSPCSKARCRLPWVPLARITIPLMETPVVKKSLPSRRTYLSFFIKRARSEKLTFNCHVDSNKRKED